MNPKISVVIPVYNVEKYLRECLDSVRGQTFKDFEVICVDDGSTDASPSILDEYAARDSRFKIFRREHSNAGAVRNFGMTKATGEYLSFLDSDDVFSPWLFETLLAGATLVNADVVACRFVFWSDGAAVPSFVQPDNIDWIDRTPDADWGNDPWKVTFMPWNKLIRRDFVFDTDIRFLEQSSTNDLTFESLAFSLSRKTIHTSEPLIAYRQHKGSIQAKKSKRSDNTLRAIEAYLNEMLARNAFSSYSTLGMGKVMSLFADTLVWELCSQTTASGYFRLHRGLREFHAKWIRLWNGATPVETGRLARYLDRYGAIIQMGGKERLRALCEAFFAPILGNKDRLTGVSLKLEHWISRFVHIVFESPRLPWNRKLSASARKV